VTSIISKKEEVYNWTGEWCTIVLAFACNNFPLLIKSCKPSLDMTIDEAEIAKDASSMQQSSEWGIRSIQTSFL
jgi:hypothetical protein